MVDSSPVSKLSSDNTRRRIAELEAEVERLRKALRLIDDAHGPFAFDGVATQVAVDEALASAR